MNNVLHRGVLEREFLGRSVKDLQPSEPISVNDSATVLQAMEALKDSSIGSVLVLGDDVLQGIFTERDVLKHFALNEEKVASLALSDAMSRNPATIKQSASVARAIHAFSTGGFRHLPVVHTNQNPIGVLSAKDVVRFVYQRLTKEHEQFECDVVGGDRLVESFFCSTIQVLQPFAPPVVSETASLYEVIERLQQSNLGAVMVVSPQGTLSGIFTERDYVSKVMLRGIDLASLPVVPYMTRGVKTVRLESSVVDAVNILWRGGFRHIPVVSEEEKPVALLSVKNFMRCLSENIIHELNQKKTSPKQS